ncbi:MAG TPA: hypothetical protein VKS79_26270 [Gemmataceae bacterium]|nr:hypothetical protein [Gemmataceae bacterium]
MRMRAFYMAALLLPLSWTVAYADIAPKPRPTPAPIPNPAPVQSKDANLIVQVDPNAKEARLIVPRSLLNRRAGLDVDDGTRLTEADGRSNRHVIIAGVALALAMSCGGLWLVRRNRLNNSGLMVCLAVSAGLIVGTVALANARAPSPAPPPPQPAPVANLAKLFDGKIRVETPADGDSIRLVVNQEMLDKIVKGAPTAPQPKPE